jgi:hypothetical protein
MTTVLTEIGWEDQDGNQLGTWTNRADVVDRGDEITVASGVKANSLAGNDIIKGTDSGIYEAVGISNNGTINTGTGNDRITGTASVVDEEGLGGYGIINNGTINTGAGNDRITGTGDYDGYGIINDGIINTGAGNDRITGTMKSILNKGTINTSTGNDTILDIFNTSKGTINTGSGNDIITATAEFIAVQPNGIINNGTINTGVGDDTISFSAGEFTYTGINNSGTINTGVGNDTISTISFSAGEFTYTGINNSGTINTGAGKDTVDALTGGFDGGGRVNLGRGDDLIRGFGNQVVDGGKGCDTAELGIDYDEITLSNALGSSIDITFDSATMAFTDVELFVFNNDVTKTLQQLQEQATI